MFAEGNIEKRRKQNKLLPKGPRGYLLYSWKFWSWKFINPRSNCSRRRSAFAGNSALLPSEVIDLPLRDFVSLLDVMWPWSSQWQRTLLGKRSSYITMIVIFIDNSHNHANKHTNLRPGVKKYNDLNSCNHWCETREKSTPQNMQCLKILSKWNRIRYPNIFSSFSTKKKKKTNRQKKTRPYLA